MPASASCSPIHAALLSTLMPRSSSVPMATTSQRMAPPRWTRFATNAGHTAGRKRGCRTGPWPASGLGQVLSRHPLRELFELVAREGKAQLAGAHPDDEAGMALDRTRAESQAGDAHEGVLRLALRRWHLPGGSPLPCLV